MCTHTHTHTALINNGNSTGFVSWMRVCSVKRGHRCRQILWKYNRYAENYDYEPFRWHSRAVIKQADHRNMAFCYHHKAIGRIAEYHGWDVVRWWNGEMMKWWKQGADTIVYRRLVSSHRDFGAEPSPPKRVERETIDEWTIGEREKQRQNTSKTGTHTHFNRIKCKQIIKYSTIIMVHCAPYTFTYSVNG